MSRDATSESKHFLEDEPTPRSITNTHEFFESCVLGADHKALEEHLVSNLVQQTDLDICLIRGLLIVQRKQRELSHVAPALTMLLQFGAKWNNDVLLADQKTPWHIICESPGDHHELLDLMMKASQQTIIDRQDYEHRTALMHAVRSANINCVKCLLANGADVHIRHDRQSSAIMEAIKMMGNDHQQASVNKDIFDLLLTDVVIIDKPPFDYYVSLLTLAALFDNVYCVKILISKGACFDILRYYNKDDYRWTKLANMGNIEVLKYMFNCGIDKDYIDPFGYSVLWRAVYSKKIEAVRYLLDLGVAIPLYEPKISEIQCGNCKENTLILDAIPWEQRAVKDPCIRAICGNQLEIVKLLEERGSQSCKCFNALRCAVIFDCMDVASYLLTKYTYRLNMEYKIIEYDQSSSVCTLLTEPKYMGMYIRNRTYEFIAQITQLLLDHGADPAKPMCSATSVNALMTAIDLEIKLEVIAQYIRSGVNINIRSYDRSYKNVLPFEASVLRGHHNVATMLLISGCSCGVFSLNDNHEFKNNLKPEVDNLIKEWEVQENNVTPLQQRCRSLILNHLSPRADEKIKKLPLPRWIIKFLYIHEFDDIIDA